MAELAVAKMTITLVWKLFAPQTASKLEQGDVAEERLRQLLLSEFNKIHEHLNALRRKELVSAMGFLETGYELMGRDQQTAQDEFRKARDAAQMAFGVVKETQDKLLAVKIMVTSAFHEFCTNLSTAQSLCSKYLERMNTLPEVVRACEVIFSPEKSVSSKLVTMTGKAQRRQILQSVAEINKCVWEYFTEQLGMGISPPPSVHFGKYHISPVTDLVTCRKPAIVAEVERNLSGFIAVASTSVYIFAALGQSEQSNIVNDIIAIHLKTGQITHLLGHNGVVLSLTANETHLFSASYDKSVIVWNVDSLQMVAKLTGHEGSVRSVCLSNRYLYSGSTDKTVKVWNIDGFTEHRSLDLEDMVSFVTCSQRKFLFAVVGLRNIQIWDTTKFEKLYECCEETGPSKIIANDSYMFVACKGMPSPSIEVWNLGSLKKTASITEDSTNVTKFYNSPYLICGFDKLRVVNTYSQRVISVDDVILGNNTTVTRINHMWLRNCSLYILCETDTSRHFIARY